MNIKRIRSMLARILPQKISEVGRDFVGSAFTRIRMRRLIKGSEPVKVEIGSGPQKRANGWLTLDMSLDSDFYWDLRRGLPFPDDSITLLYSSHVLEHFSYHELVFLLSECLRALKSGGEFSACVPDASIYLKGYEDPSRFDRSHMTYVPAVHSGLRMDFVNYVAYMDGQHKHMFDGESLIHVLQESGFQDIRLRDFDKRIDLEDRIHESLYITCRKK